MLILLAVAFSQVVVFTSSGVVPLWQLVINVPNWRIGGRLDILAGLILLLVGWALVVIVVCEWRHAFAGYLLLMGTMMEFAGMICLVMAAPYEDRFVVLNQPFLGVLLLCLFVIGIGRCVVGRRHG